MPRRPDRQPDGRPRYKLDACEMPRAKEDVCLVEIAFVAAEKLIF
jgi:hypothetical protein